MSLEPELTSDADPNSNELLAEIHPHREFHFPPGTYINARRISADEFRLTFTSPDGAHHGLAALLEFQAGPIGVYGVNGIQTEDILSVLLARTDELNRQFPCKENDEAIHHMSEALNWLNARTKRRVEAGIEGTDTEQQPT